VIEQQTPVMRPIFYMVGVACLLIGLVWVTQAFLFARDDVQAALVTWVILGAAMAGVGAAFLIAGRYWMNPDL
jgi:hypothetical protein